MEQMYTLQDAAKLLRVSVKTVRRLLHLNQTPIYRVGNNIRLKETDLNQLVTEELSLDDYRLTI